MFTLFYLETIQQTKLAEFKKKKDLNLGYRINNLILVFYMILFGALLVAQCVNKNVTGKDLPDRCAELKQTFDGALIIKSWYRTPDFYQEIRKTNLTLFDIGQVLVAVILFCHSCIIMNVARESILIFIDEHKAQNLSKTLDRKNLGVDATGFFTARNR